MLPDLIWRSQMRRQFSILSVFLLLSVSIVHADELDDYIVVQMQRRHVPGLSICVFNDGKIVKAKGYGVLEIGRNDRVTPDTLFEAASLSKPVTAAAALALVDQGKLLLDEDVNGKLTSWKVPESDLTLLSKVTLRGLLSHSAGISGDIFPGYSADEQLPALVQILNGQAPAKTPPVRVEAAPGSRWSYSGGGYLVVQQLLMDVSGRSFPALMKETVLDPLQMNSSTFQQPLRADWSARAATGYSNTRTAVPGRWLVYPEMAAAGLWSTACDVARFALAIQGSLTGSSTSLLSEPMARQMVTRQSEHSGLGAFVEGPEDARFFTQGGRDEGFDSNLIAFAQTGKGAVVMLNANDYSRMVPRILRRLAESYQWPKFPLPAHRDEATQATVEPTMLSNYEGRYQLDPTSVVAFAARKGRLYTQSDGMDDEEFLPLSDRLFVSMDREAEVSFDLREDGSVAGLRWRANNAEKVALRLAR